jgi:hypothetical protein
MLKEVSENVRLQEMRRFPWGWDLDPAHRLWANLGVDIVIEPKEKGLSANPRTGGMYTEDDVRNLIDTRYEGAPRLLPHFVKYHRRNVSDFHRVIYIFYMRGLCLRLPASRIL